MSDRPLKLLALETAHIQSYIYGSNRLRENVGASYLVAASTGQWALEIITELKISHNIKADWTFNDAVRIEADHTLDVEVIYSGGGNFVALFGKQDVCYAFCADLSRRISVEAPGLNVIFNVMDYVWRDDVLSEAVDAVIKGLKKQRGYQSESRGIAGLGVTAACNSTNLPAVTLERDLDDYNNYVLYSAEALSKRDVAEEANKQLHELLKIPDPYTFALKLDDLGSTVGELSTIAVVHADGNGLGILIQRLKAQFPDVASNRPYITHMRDLSENIKEVNRHSQQAMADRIIGAIEEHEGKHQINGLNTQSAITLKKTAEGIVFPIRPLISGGDDVTFVCDGRIAFDLATTFLEAFEYYSKKILGLALTACAGIAIVNTHYPFARAYHLAEELTGSAKQARFRQDDAQSSVIDWHFTHGGLYGDLDTMREREYKVDMGWLTLRPLFLKEDIVLHRTWSQIQRITTEFQTTWKDNRSKAKGLMSVLREGELETQIYDLRYLREDNLTLPEFGAFGENYGWDDGHCGYYDALELMDLYFPLAQVQGEPS